MTSRNMVSLRSVTKSYGSVRAMRDVSLSVPEGESYVLIGPSGCGKSTLIRTVNGLVTPESGSIEVGGVRLTSNSVRELRHKIGYSIQGGGLFPHLTVQQNVSLVARHLGWTTPAIDARIQSLCETVCFPSQRLGALPRELSGGQQQRVALMRALMLDPPLLLLDEPLGALDPMIRASLQNELRDIIRSLNKTVVFVTHDLPEATHFADKIVLMRQGRIVQIGTFSDLSSNPADSFVSEFVTAQRSLSLSP